MKKKLIYFSLGALFFSVNVSCRKALKNVDDYYPVVENTSAVVNQDGSVQVSADVTDKGYGELEYVGFCMDTLPVPDMLKNQQVVKEIDGTSFSAVYNINFNSSKTYYFRSWAANSTGYSYGNVVSLSGIKATPVTAPCTLQPNSSSVGLNG